MRADAPNAFGVRYCILANIVEHSASMLVLWDVGPPGRRNVTDVKEDSRGVRGAV